MKKISLASNHFKARLIALVFCLGVCAVHAADELLTIDETLGLVFVRPMHGGSELGAAIRVANPAAKPRLYEWLTKRELSKYHGKIISVMGFVGDASDATNLCARLDSSYEGVLSAEKWSEFENNFWALSTMANRGIVEASNCLGDIATLDHWHRTKIRSVEGLNYPHGITNEIMIRLLFAYARTGAEDWAVKAKAFKDSIPDAIIRSTVEGRLNAATVALHVREVREANQKTSIITQETRKRLARAFNGNFDQPGPAPFERLTNTNSQYSVRRNQAGQSREPLSASALDSNKKDAMTAFTNIVVSLLNDNYPDLAKSIADNGRPLLPVEKQTPEAVTARANKLKAMSRDLEITKTLVQQIQSKGFKYGEAQGEESSDGSIHIRIPCLDSQETGKRHIPQQASERTTDSEGRLVIYMIKKDGQWYWNPFGW